MKPMIQEFDELAEKLTLSRQKEEGKRKAISGVGRGKEASRKCDSMRTCH
jgi:hypothetical protein